MPLPTPNNDESYDDFMGRCISFVVDEGTEQEQAIAICQTQWEENKAFNGYNERLKYIKNNNDVLK